MELITKRLVLRPWEDADAPALYELARDPRVGTAAGWPAHTSVEQSLDILRNVLRGPEQYAVVLREADDAGHAAGAFIGAIGLKDASMSDYVTEPDEYEVGYWVGVPFWGRGYMPEAFEALIEHTRDDLGARTIWADHFEDNLQSHRVMEKCGLSFVRTQLRADTDEAENPRRIVIMKREL